MSKNTYSVYIVTYSAPYLTGHQVRSEAFYATSAHEAAAEVADSLFISVRIANQDEVDAFDADIYADSVLGWYRG
tara:strand:+ start:1025 stop:1249 length:225 start_codon:yes stop_codon:yes gene_type:complete